MDFDKYYNEIQTKWDKREARLKSCPFCGSRAHCSTLTFIYGNKIHAAIICSNSDCQAQMLGDDISNKSINNAWNEYDELICKWNERVGD